MGIIGNWLDHGYRFTSFLNKIPDPVKQGMIRSRHTHRSAMQASGLFCIQEINFHISDIMVKYPWILQRNESAIQEEYAVKYKNIVFDFGNVIGKFDGNFILEQFCSSREDMELLIPVLYRNWLDLDAGTVDYEENIETTAALVPGRLQATVRDFFRRWPEYVRPIPQTYELISRLKEKGADLYLLSNASTYFAGIASRWPILRDNFNGIVFSAPGKNGQARS